MFCIIVWLSETQDYVIYEYKYNFKYIIKCTYNITAEFEN